MYRDDVKCDASDVAASKRLTWTLKSDFEIHIISRVAETIVTVSVHQKVAEYTCLHIVWTEYLSVEKVLDIVVSSSSNAAPSPPNSPLSVSHALLLRYVHVRRPFVVHCMNVTLFFTAECNVFYLSLYCIELLVF